MSKEDSKYGFKDAQRAEESLMLLESEEVQYQKLTVRGLLGRAKRTLTMTKNEEKVKNISAAIEVYEKWLEKKGNSPSAAASKNAKPVDETKADTVPGLGFKDPSAARKTLEILEGRDPDYQKLAIKGLIGSSKRVLTGTKNEDKVKAIKDGVKILEDFLEKLDLDPVKNKAYLPAEVLEQLPKNKNKLVAEFVEVYTEKGNYKMLRTIEPVKNSSESKTWDIIRNRELSRIKGDEDKLFKDNGEPTENHLQMIYWAYSPQPAKVKSFYDQDGQEKTASKRKSKDAPAADASPKKRR